mgnify:CR=1 FL=1
MADCRIITGEKLLQPELQILPFGKVCAFTAKAGNKPGPNEDSLALITVSEEQGVLVVADGLGGHAQGGTASRIAVESVCEAVNNGKQDIPSLRELILNGIDLANSRILALESGAATTMVIVEVTGRRVRSYQVGDSFALVTGQRGRLKYQTISHSPVGYAMEAGLLSEEEALQADDRHIVSNVVGCADMRVDIGPVIKLASKDTLVLASDGLTDNMGVSDIVEQVRKGTIVDAGTKLFDSVLESMSIPSGSVDDVATVLFRLASY